MIVTCENCGKKHQIDSEEIRDVMTTFQCDACNHVMTFSIRAKTPGDFSSHASDPEFINLADQNAEATSSTPETQRGELPESDIDEPGSVSQEKLEFISLAEQNEAATPSAREAAGEELQEPSSSLVTPDDPGDINWAEEIKEATPSAHETKREALSEFSFRKKRMVGVRGKVPFLFLVISICLIITATFIHRNSIKTLTGFIIKESLQLVTKMAEEAIAEKGRFVAKEVERYLLSHPDLPKENFMQDPVLKSIGIQKVGKTGYTYLISMRTPNEASALWLHPDEKIIGKDVIPVMRTVLGDEYERWNRVQGVAFTQGTEAAGYYTWQDKREKYLVMVPVEGTEFFVASTTYLDEYTSSMKQLEVMANKLAAAAIRIMTIILFAAALIIALLFVIYSYPLSGRLKNVPDTADHIGVDDAEVKTGRTKWGNESKVAPAIRRMQDTIHQAINRLRARR